MLRSVPSFTQSRRLSAWLLHVAGLKLKMSLKLYNENKLKQLGGPLNSPLYVWVSLASLRKDKRIVAFNR